MPIFFGLCKKIDFRKVFLAYPGVVLNNFFNLQIYTYTKIAITIESISKTKCLYPLADDHI